MQLQEEEAIASSCVILATPMATTTTTTTTTTNCHFCLTGQSLLELGYFTLRLGLPSPESSVLGIVGAEHFTGRMPASLPTNRIVAK